MAIEDAAERAPFVLREIAAELPLRQHLFQNVDDFDGDGRIEVAIVSYYSEKPWSNEDGFAEFIEGGGIILSQREAAGFDADLIANQVGERATIVELGEHQGALTHADPISENGTRPYYLTWSDGSIDGQIIADLPASEVIALGRSLYCGS